jgi:predicted nucleotidyltransferase component of viral defense system
MIGKVLANKLREYGPTNAIEQENVLVELMQLFVLGSLSRSGFFRVAELHGGTFLHLVHGLDRFSEDLDFALLRPDASFCWTAHVERVVRDCAAEGLRFEVFDRSRIDTAVRKAFLKTDSLGALLRAELPYARHRARKVAIKLEVDVNPPAGSTHETAFISFPSASALTTQTLESSFASKLHALLCRSYVKGRDWYDFLWYVARGTRPNLRLLANAIDQVGPWVGHGPEVGAAWLIARLRERAAEIDWTRAREDVRRFLGPGQQAGLELWGAELFGFHLSKLEQVLAVACR